MSAESDYLQSIIDRKVEFLNNPAFSPARIGGRLDFGIEISIIEANRMPTEFRRDGSFSTSLSPGQKSYIRAHSSSLVETVQGLQWTPVGLRPLSVRTGLLFPDPAIAAYGESSRRYAYRPDSPNWINEEPWRSPPTRIRSVSLSLVPPGPLPRTGTSPQPDGRIHLLVTGPDGRTSTASNIRLDQGSMQFVGPGAPMERVDYPSLWVLSFYLFMHPPV